MLRAQKKVAATLVLGRQLFLQKTFSVYPIFFLCVFESPHTFAGTLNTNTSCSNVKPKARISTSGLILRLLCIQDFIQICESSTCATLTETDPEQFVGEQG